ncbi:hypothetical protein Q31b_52820 [Novipirellula aureliae]|uniref:Uncharacterized protein n=1 Tax=Novipirellula aureliae TaxID=2527966 RepID=A0A5C6DJU6_9BACT|nr:hypothetical protein [Novipirellula aureliae]TWU35186.1 hypothetical protein Q31b_52820 [Novipirellula aureliae]
MRIGIVSLASRDQKSRKCRTKRWTGVADRPFYQWMIARGDRGHRNRSPTEIMNRKTFPTLVLLLLLSPHLLADEVRSDLARGVYIADVSDDAIVDAPQWHDQTREPPLSMVAAVRAATAKLKTLPANSEPVQWVLHRVTLKRKGNTGWFYITTFRSKFVPDPPDGRGRLSSGSNPYLIPRDLRIPVLMDGVVPEIAVNRHTDAMLKLLDDLDL